MGGGKRHVLSKAERLLRRMDPFVQAALKCVCAEGELKQSSSLQNRHGAWNQAAAGSGTAPVGHAPWGTPRCGKLLAPSPDLAQLGNPWVLGTTRFYPQPKLPA